MRSLVYAVLLLAVLVGSVTLLRTLEGDRPERPRTMPAAQPTPPEPVESRDVSASTEEGVRLLHNGRVRAATREFESVVASNPDDYEAWVNLVECYAHPLVSREDPARDAWRRARDLVPSAGDTLYLAGLSELYLNADYGAAAGRFTSAIRAETGMVRDHDTRYQLALAHLLAGRLDDAEAQLEPLLERDGAGARERTLEIRLLVARGDLDRADARGRELVQGLAQEPYPYVLLAQIETIRGELASAEEFCSSALAIDPRFAPAILTRANLYAAAERYAAARVSFEKLLLFDDPILQAVGQDGIAFVDFTIGDFGHGRAALDEAIRHANMAGALRRSLSYASRLVAYLCELGQVDQAEAVFKTWIEGTGEFPQRLGHLRIDIMRGDVDVARNALVDIKSDKEALVWSRVLELDDVELLALTHVKEGDYDEALALLAGTAANGRRRFVEGYAAFESGDAETARSAFESSRGAFHGVEFPYRGDPVLHVQSLFYIAESAIASGDEATAGEHYAEFLEAWGDETWGLPAVERAREKLGDTAPPAESP